MCCLQAFAAMPIVVVGVSRATGNNFVLESVFSAKYTTRAED